MPVITPTITAPSNSLVIKPTTDATTAIQLADKDGNAILTVDTVNNTVTGYPAATVSASGIVELATNTEALTGTDTERAVTPDDLKYVLNRYQPRENLIGIPGQMGFGVGICPLANLPTGMTPMAGYDQLGHDNYGNYQFTDGSVMIWVPKFYYRYAHASNPTYATYGLNSVDIKGVDTYATTAEANADGYALHRAFIDGGAEKLGFFRDKYKCSKWLMALVSRQHPLRMGCHYLRVARIILLLVVQVEQIIITVHWI